MKIFYFSLFFIFFLFLLQITSAQNPLVKMWDKRFGGTDSEVIEAIQQSSDEGFILGGDSPSGISGDKTQPSWGGYDYWIVKTDSLGNKQWDKNYGGTDMEYFRSVRQTSDNGFIFSGTSKSGIGGDKTEPTWGTFDFWIVKTDSLGNKQWDKDFGGTMNDDAFCIEQTSDKGFIMGGPSTSGISGDKTQPSWGNQDYWIIKTDLLGNKQWDKSFGGTDGDILFSLLKTFDGGFILGGRSLSGISGDKTQLSWGGYDYWIVKTDSLGNMQWDKDFGGTDDDELYTIQQTSDGGFILGGSSQSSASGDKTQNSWGNWDYWIVKTVWLGNTQWDKNFGGSNYDYFRSVRQTSDSGYLISGDSDSPMSGDKTEGNLGITQTWILKTDSVGNKLWDKTIFTTGSDNIGLAVEAEDNCYLIANYSYSGIGGYKTQIAWNNSFDYWIVKFCDSTIFPSAAVTATSSLCPGTCTDFTNQSHNATTYLWSFPGGVPDTSTSINPTNICYVTPGSFDVHLIASNQNGSDTLVLTNYITVFPFPPAQAITQNSDTLFANIGSTFYQWYYNGNIISAATNYFYVATQSGDYNVVATDSNGCEVEAVINNVLARSQSDFTQDLLISVSPIPGSEKLFINSSINIVSLKILDFIGKDLFTETLFQNKVEMDIRFLSSGIYFLHIQTEKGNVVKRFIKE
jgi:hypothetical protein